MAIDPSKELVETAREHLLKYPSNDDLPKHIDYRNETIEDHLKTGATYDAVVVSEVLEHVDEKDAFLKSCTDPLLPGGSIFITTFNKTNVSWLGGIVFAEYILNMIPRGTHDWNKFIPPVETQRILEQCNLMTFIFFLNRCSELHFRNYILVVVAGGCSTVLCNGFLFEFWRKRWTWTKHHQFSYALQAVKQS